MTYQGKTLTGGSLTFVPTTEGKPASAEVQSDGTFDAGTDKAGDGIAPGSYRVSYSAPVLEVPGGKELQPGQSPPLSPFAGLVPKTPTVEIKSGEGSLDIELTRPGR